MVPRKGRKPSDLWQIFEVKCHSNHPEGKDKASNRAIYGESSSSKTTRDQEQPHSMSDLSVSGMNLTRGVK